MAVEFLQVPNLSLYLSLEQSFPKNIDCLYLNNNFKFHWQFKFHMHNAKIQFLKVNANKYTQ